MNSAPESRTEGAPAVVLVNEAFARRYFPNEDPVGRTLDRGLIAGVVSDMLVMSVRNLGYSRNAGEFVRKWFSDIGSAGGHRSMAKAVVRSAPPR